MSEWDYAITVPWCCGRDGTRPCSYYESLNRQHGWHLRWEEGDCHAGWHTMHWTHHTGAIPTPSPTPWETDAAWWMYDTQSAKPFWPTPLEIDAAWWMYYAYVYRTGEDPLEHFGDQVRGRGSVTYEMLLSTWEEVDRYGLLFQGCRRSTRGVFIRDPFSMVAAPRDWLGLRLVPSDERNSVATRRYCVPDIHILDLASELTRAQDGATRLSADGKSLWIRVRIEYETTGNVRNLARIERHHMRSFMPEFHFIGLTNADLYALSVRASEWIEVRSKIRDLGWASPISFNYIPIMAKAAGESLVAADWLDDRDQPVLAAQLRDLLALPIKEKKVKRVQVESA